MLSLIKIFSVLLPALASTVAMGQNTPNGSTRPSATAVSIPAAFTSGVQVNYVQSREAIAPITDITSFNAADYTQVRQSVQYLDGLGRPLQRVMKQGSPLLKDIVSPVVYDAYNRELYKYLPYTSTSNNGGFKLNPIGEQAGFMAAQYSGENIYYAQSNYESSPLNRVVKTMPAGNSWAGSARGTAYEYHVNTSSEAVRIWDIGNTGLTYSNNDVSTNIPSTSNVYAAGQLQANHTIDEQNNRVIEYKDKEGQVVLKKVQIDPSPSAAHSGWLCTYYVYDDYGLLRFVIPPKATQLLDASYGWNLSGDNGNMINELCFRYEYDGRNRMIAKKVPGAGWVYMVYDRRDRLVYTQDANMRTTNQWLSTLYDDQNRPVSTGMITYSGNRDALQSVLDANFDGAQSTVVAVNFMAPDSLYVNTREIGKPNYRAVNQIVFTGEFAIEDGAEVETLLGAAIISTTSILQNYNPFPASANYIPLTLTYYDDYSQTTKTYNNSNNGNIDAGGNAYPESLPSSSSLLTRGMVTGSKVRVIENPADLTSGNWLETAVFFDDKGRSVQTASDNYKNGLDITTMRYDFTNHVITNYQVHNNPVAAQTVKVKTNMLYDQAGRLLSVQKTLNDNTATTRYIARNQYDELGQLLSKQLGQKSGADNSAMEQQAYEYNIRGWLKGINKNYSSNTSGSNWFGMELNYDWGFTNNQYNGNIAGTQWRSKGDGEQRAFGFGYDAANRLLKGDFAQYTGGWNTSAGLDFSMQMGDGSTYSSAYDANGNILAMKQKGWKISGSSFIDDLSYHYTSNTNKLLNVIDAQNDPQTTLGDFRSSATYISNLGGTKTSSATDYTYDTNGNLNLDNNKDISGIVYNHLNLPYTVSVTGKGTVTYIYDAAGNKLEKRTVDNTISKSTKTTYISGYVYQNDTLQFLGQEEGRIRMKPDNSFVYDYFIKDHLGNTRMVLTEEYQQDTYPVATLEDGATATEGTYYNINTGNIVDKTTVTNFASASGSSYANNNGNPPYNTNPTSVVTATSNKLYKLNGSTGDKTGLGITLRVMSGDTVSIYGKSYWHNNGTTPNNGYSQVVNDLLTALAGTSAVVAGTHGAITSSGLTGSSLVPTDVSNWLTNAPTPGTGPKAYINWILFDEQFRVVSASSGFHKVSDAGDVIDNYAGAVNITRNGYLYVYCSNESNTDVFFDNLQVIHTRGPLLETTEYSPWGLVLQGISSKAAGKLENKHKYNSIELNYDFGLNMYDAFYRNLDPQIGRWWQIDPKPTESESPYVSMHDNPVSNSDPLGDTTIPGGGFWRNAWEGLKDGGKSTVNFVKSLGTKEGWQNLANGISSLEGMDAQSVAARNEMGMQVVNGVKNIPNMTKDDWGHAIGFGAEKVVEGALLTKGAGIAKNALGTTEAALYHYTTEGAAIGIAKTGLNLSSDGFVYSTPKGGLSPIQAQIELSLSPNRGLPNATFKFDLKGLNKAGITPTLGPRSVTGGNFGAGGGTEVLFNKPIPPEYLIRLK